MTAAASRTQQYGLYANIGARLLWGGASYYISLSPVRDPLLLFYQRLLWAFLFALVACGLTRNLAPVRQCVSTVPRTAVNVLAAIVIASNWFVVIWCIENNQLVQASLGFYL